MGSSALTIHYAAREAANSLILAMRRPCLMPCVMADAVCDAVWKGDPKGAGVLTTSQRYSRKTHRQTPSFSALSPTLFQPPGVLVTLEVSSMSYKNFNFQRYANS